MRLKLKYRNWKNSQKNIISKNILIGIIISANILIIFGACWFLFDIYANDNPNFVPKETRGEIRQGIKENIAAPLAAVIPGLGNPFYNAAWTYKNNDSFTNSNNFDGEKDNGYAGWQTYKNDELGFEIKYPEGYVVSGKAAGIKIYDYKYENYQSEFPQMYLDIYATDVAQTDLNDWVDLNKNIFIGDQLPADVEGFSNRKPFRLGSNNGVVFDWMGMGFIRNYVFYAGNDVVVVGIIGSGNTELLNKAEKVVASYKQ